MSWKWKKHSFLKGFFFNRLIISYILCIYIVYIDVCIYAEINIYIYVDVYVNVNVICIFISICV